MADDTRDHPFGAGPDGRIGPDSQTGAGKAPAGLGGSAPFADAQAPGKAYTVLARKYRPTTFEDLVGQEAMVRTLANAFRTGRIAHAFMLSGVRGVGKTTTARLLARALNYRCGDVDRPTVDLTQPGDHCVQIMESRHPDVMEMDAASRTGINDIREILDGVRYAPIAARRKVYIIDEVHMLSTAAFNGLLKTLEEPPGHVTFIFATTEIRKVPVTVLSRCQRFDLKRLEPVVLTEHLAKICALEKCHVEQDGLSLIARAAEGSVRDALSLLDQAIVQKPGELVLAADVRDMLGLADRVRILDLFEHALTGRVKEALLEIRAQYDQGADPVVVVRDLLELAHESSRAKALGRAPGGLAPADAARLMRIGETQSYASLTRLWQLLLKGHEDTARAPDPIAAAEMTLVRLAAAAQLPPPEDALKLLHGGVGAAASPGKSQSAGGGVGGVARRPEAELNSFQEVVALIQNQRDFDLLTDVERYVRPVSFEPGRVAFERAPNGPDDLAQRLARRLKQWTGDAWQVAEIKSGRAVESLSERRKREERERRERAGEHPFVQRTLKAFPDAVVRDVRDEGAAVIEGDFAKGDGARGTARDA
jgi:DNA polymerase-3 subunit gamma/tau